MTKKETYQPEIDFSSSPSQRVEALKKDLSDNPDYDGYDSDTLSAVKVVCAMVEGNRGRTEFEMTVSHKLCNRSGHLHGGAACTLLDSLTSTTLLVMAKPGFLDAGHVSRTINMSYLRPVSVGTTIRIECEAVAVGNSMANLVGTLKTLDGKVCVTCIHDKVVFSKKPNAKL